VRRPLALVLPAAAVALAAAATSGLAGRQAHLFAALDRWGLERRPAVALHQDPLPGARALAATVVAANPHPSDLPLLGLYLSDPDPAVRERVMLAAGRLGAAALELARRGLADPSPAVRAAAAWAACHGGAAAWPALEAVLGAEREPLVLEALLANLWRLEAAPWPAAAARYAAHADPYLRRAAAFSLARSAEGAARGAQRSLAADPEPVIRATVLRSFGLGELAPEDVAALAGALADPDWRVRAAACSALAARPPLALPAAAALAVATAFKAPELQLAAAALAAAAAQPAAGTADELQRVARGSEPWLAAGALAALAARTEPAAAALAAEWAAAPEPWRRRAAARVAARLGAAAEAKAAADPDPAVRLAWLEALEPAAVAPRRERLTALLDADPDPAVRAQALGLLRAAGLAPPSAELLRLAAAWGGDRLPDARAEALTAAFAAAADDAAREVVWRLALADADPAVGALVAAAARGLGHERALPRREARHGSEWYEELAAWAAEPRWLDLHTSRGNCRIRLDLASAPLSAREIWELAAAGFYDGLTVHRVVPNFVVQGGDPRGDGWGGPGWVLPDEPSLTPFDSWRVGIATSGPQTGGCQLFVTLLPADHLTGHYTNLGEVVEGRAVLTALAVGDRILKLETRSGAAPPPLASLAKTHP